MNRLGKTLSVLLVSLMVLSAMPVQGEGARETDGTFVPERAPRDPTPVGAGSGSFTENQGQWGSHVRFVARCPFGEAVFGPDGVTYDVRTGDGGHRVKVAFTADTPVEPFGVGELATRTSYFRGSDPAGWVSGARSYRELLYEDVWPGVDVRYRFRGDSLKYDVIAGPGSDVSDVGFELEGHQGLDVRADGLDILLSPGLALHDEDLVASYDDGEAVSVRFTGRGDAGYGFDVDKAPGRSLVIDPIVVHSSTYVGGTYDDTAGDVEVDDEGNIYITGITGSSDYPVTSGAYCEELKSYDVQVTKLNHNCSRVIWSTYLGGNSTDFITGIEVDDEGNVLVAGGTWSSDFPTTKGALQRDFNLGMNNYGPDVWITKFSPDGDALVYSTYVGGSGPETVWDFKLWNGRATAVGWTDSKDFPTNKGPFAAFHGDGYLFMLDGNGSQMVAFQFWGGSSSEIAYALDFDSNGDVVVGGLTNSPDFHTTPGVYQEVRPVFSCGFVSKYSPSEDRIRFSTHLGGAQDWVTAITVDEDHGIYIGGRSYYSGPGATFPVTPGAFDVQYNGRTEGFVCKMDPNATRLEYSTLLGGDGDDYVNDIQLMGNGTVMVVGEVTSGGNFTVTSDALDAEYEGDSEGYVFVMNADGTAPVYSSYIGGQATDAVGGVAITGWDNWVLAGETSSTNYRTTPDAFQRKNGGASDVFVTVMGDPLPTSAPRNLNAFGAEGHIALNWQPPLEDHGYPVRSYLVLRGTSPDDLRLYRVLGDVTVTEDEDVEWGVTYYYGVIALNGKGESPMSNVASAVSVTVPEAPANLTGTVLLDGILLEWEAPGFTGGIPVTEYRLYRTVMGEGEPELHATIEVRYLSFTDSDLIDGTTYEYWLTAVNEWGESRSRATIVLRAVDVPTPPRDLNHTYGDLFIRLTWRVPEDDFGFPVETYNVYRSEVEGPGEWMSIVAATNRSFLDERVEVGMPYLYAVSAVNAKGESIPCQPIEAKAMVRPDPPKGVRASALEAFVRVSWSPPGFDGASPLLGYRVYHGEDPGTATYLGGVNVEGVEDPRLVFLHGVPYDGVARHYFVTAVNAEGESDPSQVAVTKAYEAPSAPLDLQLAWGDREIGLGWRAPDDDGGTPVTSFTLYRRAEGEDEFVQLASIASDILEYLDGTTFNGVEYTYRLTATNLVGEGAPSLEVTGMPAGQPDPPVELRTEALDGAAHLTWEPPTETGGLPIDGYLVFAVSDGLQMELLAELDAGVNEHTVTGLENGGVYLLAVRATTGAGRSDLSEIVEVRPVGPPSDVQALIALWVDDHVHLTWSAPLHTGGSPIRWYLVHREDWDEGNWTRIDPLNLTYLDRSVEPGRTYNYTVHASNDVGDGPLSQASVSIPVPKEAPPVDPETNMWPYVVVGLVLAIACVGILATFRRREVVE